MYIKVIVLALPYYIKSEYIYYTDENVEIGSRVAVNFNGKERYGVVIDTNVASETTKFKIKKINKVIDKEPIITQELIELSRWMEKFYISSLSQCLSLILPSSNSPGKAKNLKDDAPLEKKEYKMNDAQQEAFDTLCKSLFSGYKLAYIHGVTGSGKTIVFLNLAKKVVESGKSVIYLVPEIGLTVQLYSTLLSFFSEDEIAIIHSNISSSKRIAIWKDIRLGKIKIVISTRSGIFAPFENLGLIIMDEEQDNSYKSDNSPTFSTRHIAQKRAMFNKCALIAGSATPSLEYYKQIKDGEVECVHIDKRVRVTTLPKIISINTYDCASVITDELKSAMLEELDKGYQVILFLNRRGYLYHYKCPDCGYEVICPHCSVNMTYHREQNLFICHRCNEKRKVFSKCPQCSSKNEIYTGYGTEYVEKIVKEMFPFYKTLRMDTDTITNDKKSKEIIKDFENRKANILIGTQMLSKGLNFPYVSLVGVLNATSSTSQNDFRADEKLFSLLVQVAGRSGRMLKNSKVILQCDDASIPVIEAVKKDKQKEFYENELLTRQRFDYPPFSRMARLVVRSKDEYISNTTIANISQCINITLKEMNLKENDYINIMQYGKCPIYKEKDYFRMQIVLKSNDITALIGLITHVKNKINYTDKFFLEIDIDPVNMF